MAILKNAARCNKCGTIVESKSTDDWQSCKCGAIYVVGGKDHLGRGYQYEDDFIDLSEQGEDAQTIITPNFTEDKAPSDG